MTRGLKSTLAPLVVLQLLGCEGALGDTARESVARMLEDLPPSPGAPLSETDIADLPPPVQRYLRRSLVVGKIPSRFVRLKQTGRIKTQADGDWVELTAEEYFLTDRPAFVWLARTTGFPKMNVIDSYLEGRGRLAVELPPIGNLVDASGPAFDEGELMRYLSEMIWFPTALAGNLVTWQALTDNSARATLRAGDVSVSGVFHFDTHGDFVNFIGAERPRVVDDEVSRERWSTPVNRYREVAGYRLPVEGAGVWHLEQGDLTYVEIEVTEIEFDVPAFY